MRFYKILRQLKLTDSPFLNILKSKDYEHISGESKDSFAIVYNPENYNKLLNDSIIFREFKIRAIQQLFITNQKYLAIICNENFFNMEMRDCMFTEDSHTNYLDEYGELSIDIIKHIVENNKFTIKEVTFVMNETKKMIILQNNGVIGIDNGMTKNEHQQIVSLIDTLNLGLKVIKK